MQILDGKVVSSAVRSALIPRIDKIKSLIQRPPHLVVLIVGEDPASQVYVKNKHIACEKIGLQSTVLRLPQLINQTQLIEQIEKLNQDPTVDAVLVQLPLPGHLSSESVLKTLLPSKDADGLTYGSLGLFFAGQPLVKPCTPAGVMKILEHYQIKIEGKKAVVVGRSSIVGKPMAMLLTEANATVTLCHSKTPHVQEETLRADIVVVAAGRPGLMGKSDFKQGAVIIDVGIHGAGSGKLCGDVRPEGLDGWVSAATPVPGGVGPMTITMLLENTCVLVEKRLGIL